MCVEGGPLVWDFFIIEFWSKCPILGGNFPPKSALLRGEEHPETCGMALIKDMFFLSLWWNEREPDDEQDVENTQRAEQLVEERDGEPNLKPICHFVISLLPSSIVIVISSIV